MSATPAYGLWPLVIVNSLVFIIFAFSFAQPKSARDWRSFGAFSAFIVALFAEMYGFPLTIYLLAGWLQSRYPGVDWFAHDAGHLLEMLLGWRTEKFPGMDIFSHDMGHLLENFLGWGGDPHFGPFHILSFAFIGGGFILLSRAWRVLYAAQRAHTLATTGPYARIRHPQYAAFVLIMLGFLVQWPTLLTLAMFPVLAYMYVRLARREEREVAAEFGPEYKRYAARTPAFIPRRRTAPLAD